MNTFLNKKLEETIMYYDENKIRISYKFMSSKKIKFNVKGMFLYLKSCADENGNASVSNNQIAREMGLSKPSIIKYLRELESLGLIKIEKRVCPETGQLLSNNYVIYEEKENSF